MKPRSRFAIHSIALAVLLSTPTCVHQIALWAQVPCQSNQPGPPSNCGIAQDYVCDKNSNCLLGNSYSLLKGDFGTFGCVDNNDPTTACGPGNTQLICYKNCPCYIPQNGIFCTTAFAYCVNSPAYTVIAVPCQQGGGGD